MTRIVYLVLLMFAVATFDSGPASGAEDSSTALATKYVELMKTLKEVGNEPDPLFKLWQSTDKNKSEAVYMEVPTKMLGNPFVITSALAGGTDLSGYPLDQGLFGFEKRGTNLVLVEPEVFHVRTPGHKLDDVIKRSHPGRVAGAFPIVAASSKGIVIDLGKWLKSNWTDVAWVASGSVLNTSLSRWKKLKPFPKNVEIAVELMISDGRYSGNPSTARYKPVVVHHSFYELPIGNGYKAREADDRVGYFVVARRDWTKEDDSRDLFHRYIERWDLRKANPEQAMSAVKEPIVFIIEKTVPPEYRPAVREGILMWNEAFRNIGLIDPIEVRQQDTGNEYDKIDLEDMRYPSFRWNVDNQAIAYGPSRVDPRSGQILDADILFSEAMVRAYTEDVTTFGLVSRKVEAQPELKSFFERHPRFLPSRFGEMEKSKVAGDSTGLLERYRNRNASCRRGCDCGIATQMGHQLRLARAVLAPASKESKDRFMFEIVREITAHEVGHTLGLRHNFKASSVWNLTEIKERRKTGQPLSGSVMDYNPSALFAGDLDEGTYVTPKIGPYDEWAIEYGYRSDIKTGWNPPKPKLKKGEKASTKTSTRLSTSQMLAIIAGRASEPELVYGSDEDASLSGVDPMITTFDMGDNPVAWAKARIELIDQRLAEIMKWGVEDGESYHHLRETFLTLIQDKHHVFDQVTKMVGGQEYRRAHKGDKGGPPFVVIDAETQRYALQFLRETLYADGFFTASPELMVHLAASRWNHQGAFASTNPDFDFQNVKRSLYWWTVFDVYYPNKLNQILNAEGKSIRVGKSGLTLVEYLTEYQDVFWDDALDVKRAADGKWSAVKPFVSADRRALQGQWLGVIEVLVRSQPDLVIAPDVQSTIRQMTRELAKDIGIVVDGVELDLASKGHLNQVRDRIERILKPEISEY